MSKLVLEKVFATFIAALWATRQGDPAMTISLFLLDETDFGSW